MINKNLWWQLLVSGLAGGLLCFALVSLMVQNSQLFFPLLSPRYSPASKLIPSEAAWLQEVKIADIDISQETSQPSLLFSPNGERFALVTSVGAKEAVILDGKTGPAFDKITFLTFSPDSRSFAYIAKDGNREKAVINGEVGQEFDWIFAPRIFNSDGQLFAYRARQGESEVVVINQEVSRLYKRILSIFVNPENDQIIFFATLDNQLWRGQTKVNSPNN